ncbi:MAG: hypothetical protein KC657_25025 [Myxococcales bacterium]|nr:hypothetical protein [Myxococcales bacterium]
MNLSPPVVPPLRTRAHTAARAAATLARDHTRLDQVLELAVALNLPTIKRRWTEIAGSEEGRALLEERPKIDEAHVDYAALTRLPDGTLGREYARFLADNGISPAPFATPPDVGSEGAAWVMMRFRQSHDIWHVLTGYAPDVEGELLLQAFTFAQAKAPASAFLVLFGTLRYAWRFPRGYFRRLARAYRRGKATTFLGTVRWESLWERPVGEVRATLGCPA